MYECECVSYSLWVPGAMWGRYAPCLCDYCRNNDTVPEPLRPLFIPSKAVRPCPTLCLRVGVYVRERTLLQACLSLALSRCLSVGA
jgi:hypothetical protein